MEALSEPDHVSVPDSTRCPSERSVVTAVSAISVGTSSEGCDRCPLPPAADPLAAPAADDQPEISALGRNLAQKRFTTTLSFVTVFCTPTRLFEWLVLPQGSSAAPGWFVKVINEVIKGLANHPSCGVIK